MSRLSQLWSVSPYAYTHLYQMGGEGRSGCGNLCVNESIEIVIVIENETVKYSDVTFIQKAFRMPRIAFILVSDVVLYVVNEILVAFTSPNRVTVHLVYTMFF